VSSADRSRARAWASHLLRMSSVPTLAACILGAGVVPAPVSASGPPVVIVQGDELPRELRQRPKTAAELEAFVEALRKLGQDRLIVVLDAENRFRKSAVVDHLESLSADWVPRALGSLAVAESDPLVKAALVFGLCAGVRPTVFRSDELVDDFLPRLLEHYARVDRDEYEVGRDVIFLAYMACRATNKDYVQLVRRHLEASDNSTMLTRGYFFLSEFPESPWRPTLEWALENHPNDNGRLGAIEGLRVAARSNLIGQSEVAELFFDALKGEEDVGNQSVLLDALLALGGATGVEALEQISSGAIPRLSHLRGDAVQLLVGRLEPREAMDMLIGMLEKEDVAPDLRASLLLAMAHVELSEAEEWLLRVVVQNDARDIEYRRQGLSALWGRDFSDPRIDRVLRTIYEDSEEPGVLRAECLRMLVVGSGSKRSSGELTLKSVAEHHESGDVRAMAIQLIGYEQEGASRDWLFERLFAAESDQERASALSTLIGIGGGDVRGRDQILAILRDELERLEPSERAPVSTAIEFVEGFDFDSVVSGLTKEAEFYSEVSELLTGRPRRSALRVLEQVRSQLRQLQGASGD